MSSAACPYCALHTGSWGQYAHSLGRILPPAAPAKQLPTNRGSGRGGAHSGAAGGGDAPTGRTRDALFAITREEEAQHGPYDRWQLKTVRLQPPWQHLASSWGSSRCL